MVKAKKKAASVYITTARKQALIFIAAAIERPYALFMKPIRFIFKKEEAGKYVQNAQNFLFFFNAAAPTPEKPFPRD